MVNQVIAEITVSPSARAFAWYVFAPGVPADQSVGEASTPSEAVWRAVDALQRSPVCGRIAVLSDDGSKVAYAPLCAVPEYDKLSWEPSTGCCVDLGQLEMPGANAPGQKGK